MVFFFFFINKKIIIIILFSFLKNHYTHVYFYTAFIRFKEQSTIFFNVKNNKVISVGLLIDSDTICSHHDIAEILLKLALNNNPTINQSI